jgi:hypothetical protein
MDVPSLEPRRARWNHTRRFEGITKSNLQGNSAPKAENLQIRLFDRPQLAEPFNALGVLHGRRNMAETHNVQVVVVRMPLELAERLDVEAERRFTTRSEYVRGAYFSCNWR